MLCGIGSRMIAATSWSVSARSTSSASLNRQTIVASRTSGRIPCESGSLPPTRLGRRDHVHRHRVVPAVVAALELDHVAAAGDRAREPERVEGRLAPGRRQQHLLERGHDVDEPLGELDLDRRDADAHQPGRVRGGRVDVGVVVPEERRPEGGVVVGVDAAVRVGEGRAARRGDDEVLEAGNAALSAVHASWDHGGRARGEPARRPRMRSGSSCLHA